jgi:hypothetical protein
LDLVLVSELHGGRVRDQEFLGSQEAFHPFVKSLQLILAEDRGRFAASTDHPTVLKELRRTRLATAKVANLRLVSALVAERITFSSELHLTHTALGVAKVAGLLSQGGYR